jgi:hypothetical protein
MAKKKLISNKEAVIILEDTLTDLQSGKISKEQALDTLVEVLNTAEKTNKQFQK